MPNAIQMKTRVDSRRKSQLRIKLQKELCYGSNKWIIDFLEQVILQQRYYKHRFPHSICITIASACAQWMLGLPDD